MRVVSWDEPRVGTEDYHSTEVRESSPLTPPPPYLSPTPLSGFVLLDARAGGLLPATTQRVAHP